MTNARKQLARLEPQTRSAAPARRRSKLVSTAADATKHSPPVTKEWKRRQRIVAVLRLHLWHGASRTHAPTGTRSMKDPEASENVDVAGAMAIAARESALRAMQVNIYLYKNWPHFAKQAHKAMTWLATLWLIGKIGKEAGQPWVTRLAKLGPHKADALIDRIVAKVLAEFTGRELTAEKRARYLLVRDKDWRTTWRIPYLELLDFLNGLEKKGARAHELAL